MSIADGAPREGPRGRKKATPSSGKANVSTPSVRGGASSTTPRAKAAPSAGDDIESRIFKAVADNAFYGNVFIDGRGTFRYVNECFAAMHGYRPEELIGRHISLVHTPEQLAVSKRIIETSIRNGNTKPQEHWYLHRDGTVFPLLVSCASISSNEGAGPFTALSAVDASPIRRAEAAYETLFNEMLDGFAHHQIICDDSGVPVDYRFLAVNPAFERMTGLQAAGIIGRTVLEVLPGTEQRWIDVYGKVALTGEPELFEDYASPLDKHFSVTAFRPAPGEFACIFQDITDRKRSEEALRRSEHELRRTQRLAHVGSWTWDFAKDEVTWTGMLFEVFGLEPRPTAPTFSEQEALVTASTYEALREAVAETRATGVPYEVELEIPRGDGPSRWLWARGEPVVDAQGRTTGLWGAAQDITERKEQAAERERLEAQLARAQRLESVGRLAGSVAHDFNNMLTVILGHAELNLSRIAPEDPLHAELEEIREAAERSADLTRQLLAFARNQPASPQVIDVNETVGALLTMLRRLVGEDIKLRWKPGSSLSPVRVDPSQIDHILANLVVNARDAIGQGGTVTIETANVSFDQKYCAEHPDRDPGEYVEIAVTDDGSGMDAQTQAHIFEPFFTTKELGRGTGLGLSTVYGVARQNQGFVSVYSELGVGTTFRVYLPHYSAEPVSSRKVALKEAQSLGSETVLVVEDEPGILKIVTTMLEGKGYAVLSASTPGGAIRVAEEHSGAIDLLLTDVIMPEMNGRALADLLRELRPDLKCLFMSGYTANVITDHGLPDDAVHFISKPFGLDELTAKVRETLDA